jgi:hypothetical protein
MTSPLTAGADAQKSVVAVSSAEIIAAPTESTATHAAGVSLPLAASPAARSGVAEEEARASSTSASGALQEAQLKASSVRIAKEVMYAAGLFASLQGDEDGDEALGSDYGDNDGDGGGDEEEDGADDASLHSSQENSVRGILDLSDSIRVLFDKGQRFAKIIVKCAQQRSGSEGALWSDACFCARPACNHTALAGLSRHRQLLSVRLVLHTTCLLSKAEILTD